MRRVLMVVLLLALNGCGQAPPPMAGGKWAEALRAPDAQLRRKAAFVLGNIGPSDPAALPALIAALKDPDERVRYEVILALVKFGPDAREAIPALADVRQHDRSSAVRKGAALVLEKIRGD